MIKRYADLIANKFGRIGSTPEEVKKEHETLIKLRNELLSNRILKQQYQEWQQESERVAKNVELAVGNILGVKAYQGLSPEELRVAQQAKEKGCA